jgi:tetratricopeptide (TPR) repeat protein
MLFRWRFLDILETMKLLWVATLAFGFLTFASLADAEDTAVEHKLTPHELRDDTLDTLFAKLQRASSEDDAKQTEQKIWEVWSQSDSVTADVLLNQAVVAMNAGDNKSCFQILNQVIAAYPTYAEAWNKRATLNFMIGRYHDSLSDIDKVLELEPRHFGALAGKGMIYRAQEKWGDALDAFKEALAINPNMTSVKNAIRDLEKRQPAL